MRPIIDAGLVRGDDGFAYMCADETVFYRVTITQVPLAKQHALREERKEMKEKEAE